MKPQELANLIFGRDHRCDIENLPTTDRDYYKCHECGDNCLNISYDGYNFVCVSCDNGCQTHGDVILYEGRPIPKMVKKFLLEYYKQK